MTRSGRSVVRRRGIAATRCAGRLPATGGLVLLALLFSAAVDADAEQRPSPPNLILVLTDDQRWDELGFLDPTLDTPALDALARDGVHFRNAFVTTSLCSPSRASILTGQTMRNHGVIDNNSPLPEDLELFPGRLRDAGYETAFVGKWHMGGEASPPRPEFDRWVSFPGQGSYLPTDMLGRPVMLDVDGSAVPQRGYITDELTDYAIDFLQRRDPARPFFLYLSHKAVHAPFVAAERHASQYGGAEIPVGSAAEDPGGVPIWVQNQRNSWHGEEFAYHSELPLAEFRREYRRALSAVDDSVARLRQWLRGAGLEHDTVIVFTSDNGFLFGEHGLIDKRNAYEESMRVPLLAVAPGRFPAGGTRPEMVANIDLAPTLLELAELAPSPQHDGVSWAKLAAGEELPDWRRELAYEYYWEYNYPHTPTTFALRTPRYKYVQYHGVWDLEELFDLTSDPRERRNLIDDPQHLSIKVDLRQRLWQAVAPRQGDRLIPLARKVNQGAALRSRDGSPAAEFPHSWLRSGHDGDELEHLVPDGPAKEQVVRRLHEVLRPEGGPEADVGQEPPAGAASQGDPPPP